MSKIKEEIEEIFDARCLELVSKTNLLLTKPECLALVEVWDNAYVSQESTLAFQAYQKIYNFAVKSK